MCGKRVGTHEWTDRVDTCSRDPLRWVDKTDVVLPQTGKIGKEGEEQSFVKLCRKVGTNERGWNN